MTLWLDAQLSPKLAPWIQANLGVEALSVRDLGLRDASDRRIFLAARQAGAVVVTKDADFLTLQKELGAPPAVIWLTMGNTSNAALQTILSSALASAVEHLRRGEPLVEIRWGNPG